MFLSLTPRQNKIVPLEQRFLKIYFFPNRKWVGGWWGGLWSCKNYQNETYEGIGYNKNVRELSWMLHNVYFCSYL